MIKVCFFVENGSLNDRDFSNPDNGNPGIGGTEFMIWSIAYYLNKYYSNLKVILLAPFIDSMPDSLECVQCQDALEGVKICKEINGDIFIFKGPYHDKTLFNLIDNLKVKSVMWSHNYESLLSLKYIMECEYLKRNICVSKEQYHKLMDHEAFEKSTYIYNALDFRTYEIKQSLNINKENAVCFMGGLRLTKGFHLLAEAWPKVVKEVPDAKLYVLGGAVLYNKEAEIGSFGIADPDYEKRFIPYLLDNDGNLMRSVEFCGVLNGKSKTDLISQCKVGIANPSGFGETFCISAIEFSALGIPVVTVKKNGLLNTVLDQQTGLLFSNKEQLAQTIVTLLKDNQLNQRLGENGAQYVREKFDILKICERWNDELQRIYKDELPVIELDNSNLKYNYKWLRKFNRNLRRYPVLKYLPTVLEVEERTARFRKL
ncbi:MAG: glycosyltransferase family 4 protein [Turicibacter sp.]|nr:glycosyltransferase family 4 protein [Turicibacter sp.]